MVEQPPETQRGLRNGSSDVVVVGAGMAGNAASIELARAGLKVTCISPAEATRPAVGESLDWSAPDLLKVLGLSMDHLVESRMATWKRHVTLRMRDGCSEHYIPTPWLGEPPLNIELRTLHLDRVQIDQELLKLTTETGVRLVPDKVVAVERAGKRVRSVRTASGANYSGAWFIDASGVGASLFARDFNLPKIEHGPAKVALWKYFRVSDPVEGTTLYMDPSPSEYLGWIWEIPVNPETVSVGVVTTGALMKARRDQGLTIDEVFQQELGKFSRFEGLLRAGAIGGINVTSFKCRVYMQTAGPNWLICGEAASMVDPITANGVTAALRHAVEASSLILRYRTKGKLPLRTRICYSSRIVQMAKFFNSGIEKIVYEPPVRNRIGLQKAGTVYTSPAWSMNVVYARLKPGGIFSTLLLNSMLGTFRLSAWVVYHLSRRKRSTGDPNDQCRIAA
ncbi:MAG TPA: NAD(P)/FAD-dependent oxidoreductase [Candidatus Sulfotelmatobacter sp.]|nr:NAD(P)/FAD-dependent oxidoreductase [Candidatus Sulfotelmatobacter sp.]